MKPPRNAEEYRHAIIEYSNRSYTKTLFQGYIYRFLAELLKNSREEKDFYRGITDLDDHTLAHLAVFRADAQSSYDTSLYSYSELRNLVETPLPAKGVGQVLFLSGHMPGSWISAIGAKYGIGPEFFRRHIHVWRALRGPVLYAVPTLPSVNWHVGIPLQIITAYESTRTIGNPPLASRQNMLPHRAYYNPSVLTPDPGSTYVRNYAFLDDREFIIEQDISITIESDGDGWTAILWSDIGSRDLSQSQDFRWFFEHLKASRTGHRSICTTPAVFLAADSQRQHPLPTPAPGSPNPNPMDDGALTPLAAHLPREFHLMLDHEIAALDPLYALSPIFQLAATTNNGGVIGKISRQWNIISSTKWDPKHSQEHMERMILYKHILDDNACRHEQVLHFLRSPHLLEYSSRLTPAQRKIADIAKGNVEADYEYLLRNCREYSQKVQEAISILTSVTAHRESSKQIILATQVTRLTVLATIFLPLSFCTSIFGMNFNELVGLSIWIWALVTVLVGIATLLMYQWGEREQWVSPAVYAWTKFWHGVLGKHKEPGESMV